MLDAVIAAVREVARDEVMPRFLRVAHQRKADGTLTTAAGRFDVYLHGGQKLWDYAGAGSLILAESGGCLCGLEHDDFSQGGLWLRSVIAALDPRLFETWKNWVWGRM